MSVNMEGKGGTMPQRTALVTGADRGFGLFVARELAQRGWLVFAGRVLENYDLLDRLAAEYPSVRPLWLDVSKTEDIERAGEEIARVSGRLDVLFSNAALMGGPGASALGGEEPIDFDALERYFMINAMAGILLVDRLLPLLEKGEMKRLHFTSSEISSLRLMTRTGSMRYAMTKTALNLGIRMLFNDLRPRGYTFRLYQPGGMNEVLPDGSYKRKTKAVDPAESAASAVAQLLADRVDEDRLALIDYHGRELSF